MIAADQNLLKGNYYQLKSGVNFLRHSVPLRHIMGTFFGKIQNVITDYLINRTAWHTVNILGICCTRETGWENFECTYDVLGGYLVGTLSMSLQCTYSVPGRKTGFCPQ